MNIQQLLMQKNGVIVSSLAREFMGYEVGDRIHTIQGVAKQFKVGNGTVQAALNRLEDVGAVRFTKHGYKGTLIAEINYARLASLCGINSILGIMPIPFSRRYEGLATALHQTLNVGEVKVNLAFMSGALNRITSLMEERYDFALVSQMSAVHFKKEHPQLDVVAGFGSGSFVSSHVVLKRKGFSYPSLKNLKIGVDEGSYDQKYITSKFFEGQDIKTVPIRYSNILHSLINEEIDLAIWSKDNINISDNLVEIATVIPHSADALETKAAIVTLTKEGGIKKYLARYLKEGLVEKIQKAVLEGQQVSIY